MEIVPSFGPNAQNDEFKLMELFETQKAQVVALQQETEKTDKEIDKMVYNLYGLIDEEIRIIEGP